jgi:SPP1 family predicted phage head-tail adaptor
MNIGDLNRRIAFITYEEAENTMGLTELKEKELLTCWAKIEPAKGREYYEAQKIRTENSYKITTRYHKNLNNSMLIKYQNQTFEIQNIVDPYMKHIELEFYCTEKSRGEGATT